MYIDVECLLFLKVHAITMTMTYEPPVFFPAHSNSRRKSCHAQIISQRFTICDVFAMAQLYHGEAGRKIRTNVLCFCNVGHILYIYIYYIYIYIYYIYIYIIYIYTYLQVAGPWQHDGGFAGQIL